MVSKVKKTLKTKVKTRLNKHKLDSFKKGDAIEIIAPGSHAPIEHLKNGIAVLQSWGFEVIVNPEMLEPKLFLANSDKKRFELFKRAMNNKKTKAVWCLRGGYGSIRILPMIEKMAVPQQPKLLIGISDICSLHAIINEKWKMASLHAPLVDRIGMGKLNENNMNELMRVLVDTHYVTKFVHLKPLNKAATKNKIIKSKVVGGNLMVVTSTLGTPSQIKGQNKIIFLEELCERSYRIDRCLQQLKQAGVFDAASAVVFGDFLNCDEPNGTNLVLDTLKLFFDKMKIPAFTGLECGHGDIQRPLFFNTETHLTCGLKPQMVVYSAFGE